MEDERKFWITFWMLVTILLVTLILSIPIYCYNLNKLAFTNGYERVTIIGSDYTVWHKVK